MLPKISYINADRDMGLLQSDLLLTQGRIMRREIQAGSCIFDGAKPSRHCFQCIGLIHREKSEELSIMEISRLMEFKMYQVNLSSFTRRLNENFHKNGGLEEILYSRTGIQKRFLRFRPRFTKKNPAGWCPLTI